MSKKEDILFLCQYFYPEYVSSATLPFDTAKELVKAGYSVSALCGYPFEYNTVTDVSCEEIHEGIKIKRLKYLQTKRSNFLGRLINYFSFTFVVLLRFFSLNNYKLIIVYSNPPVLPLIAALASSFFNTKMIFVCYDVYPEMAYVTNSISRKSFISKIMQFINKVAYSKVSKVIALSNEMKSYLLEHRTNIDNHQIEVIPNWFVEKTDVKDANFAKYNKFFDLKSEKKLIVSYFGNMGVCQDLETILESIKVLRSDEDIGFIFAGHGTKINHIKKLVNEESLQNTYVYDFLHGQDFQDALSISDVFLVSLTKGLTGLAVPSKTYSYMMASKPIIAIMGLESDISKELIENEAGFAFEVGEIEKTVNAILKLKNDEELRLRMGKNVRRIFEDKYTMEKSTRKYVELIKEVIGVN